MKKTLGTRIVPRTVRIRNPLETLLVVWIEPWAERYELASRETLDVSFVGPESGTPEFLPGDRKLAIYGWQGCEFIATRNGRVAGPQPTIHEIIIQELDIAKESIRCTALPLPVEDIDDLQRSLDCYPILSVEAQAETCRLVGFLVSQLTNCLFMTGAATVVLWHIASRVVRTKGLVLTELETNEEPIVWGRASETPGDLILARSISMLPDGLKETEFVVHDPPTMPRHVGSGSDANPE